jgi:presenilin-like A22 family membrane protease
MSDKLRIYFGSFTMYALTMAASLTAAWQHVTHPGISGGVGPIELSVQTGVIFLVVFAVFTAVIVRFAVVARLLLSFFLVVALIAGSQFILSAWIGMPYDIIGAISVALLLWAFPRVLVHDVAIVLGIGGLAAVLGLSLTPLVAAVLLAALSVYDIFSVYRTRHMVVLAGRMLQSGAVFGFLVPARLSGFFMRRDEALRTRAVMMLGSGDIGLPLVLATSAVSVSITAAVIVAAATLIGVSVMHWLFVHQERPAPMAALPPIAVCAILGYLLAILLGV